MFIYTKSTIITLIHKIINIMNTQYMTTYNEYTKITWHVYYTINKN